MCCEVLNVDLFFLCYKKSTKTTNEPTLKGKVHVLTRSAFARIGLSPNCKPPYCSISLPFLKITNELILQAKMGGNLPIPANLLNRVFFLLHHILSSILIRICILFKKEFYIFIPFMTESNCLNASKTQLFSTSPLFL